MKGFGRSTLLYVFYLDYVYGLAMKWRVVTLIYIPICHGFLWDPPGIPFSQETITLNVEEFCAMFLINGMFF